MEILKELLPGCFLLRPKVFEDSRGLFVKTFDENKFKELNLDFKMREEFYSISNLNVIRGMHFQTPPYDHEKLVYCTQGSALDVLLDLRVGGGYGESASTILSSENKSIVFIPKGVAHGFISKSDSTLMMYKTTMPHNPESDCGIHWASFGFNWGVDCPQTSIRDSYHPYFSDFNSPFFSDFP